MQRAIDLSNRVARSSLPLLLAGEHGVGKKWLALQIHANSGNPSAPWIQLHCGVDCRNSLASQFQAARGGTLYLEDIDQAPFALQVELTLLVESFATNDAPINASLPSSIRLIASTTYMPSDLASRELLRPNLFFLFHPGTVCIPPLRERTQDIPLLVEHFLTIAAKLVVARFPVTLKPHVLAEILRYPWPGNLDQLQSCLRRAALHCIGPDETIDLESELLSELLLESEPVQSCDLSARQPLINSIHNDSVGRTLTASAATALTVDIDALTQQLVRRGMSEADKARQPLHSYVVNQVEKELIAQVLDECEQVQTKAALRLGINRNTLHKKVKEYDLESEAFNK